MNVIYDETHCALYNNTAAAVVTRFFYFFLFFFFFFLFYAFSPSHKWHNKTRRVCDAAVINTRSFVLQTCRGRLDRKSNCTGHAEKSQERVNVNFARHILLFAPAVVIYLRPVAKAWCMAYTPMCVLLLIIASRYTWVSSNSTYDFDRTIKYCLWLFPIYFFSAILFRLFSIRNLQVTWQQGNSVIFMISNYSVHFWSFHLSFYSIFFRKFDSLFTPL